MVKNNMAMFQRAMEMFSPQGGARPTGNGKPAGPSENGRDDLDALRGQVEALKKQLDELAKREG